MWIVVLAVLLVAMAVALWLMGWRWESTARRPRLGRLPKVSILIPAYKSESTIGDTLESIEKLDYPSKEVIVANDYPDRTPEICRQHRAQVISSRKRLGKAEALNRVVKKATGDILFFMDADTTATKDCLKKVVPWFSDPEIAAVSPKYVVRNKKNVLTKLISIENSFISSFFKTNMFFGSLIAFRGCGVAIRKSAFEKAGGWSNTMIEDNDLAAKLVERGFRIHYDPEAVVKTREPESMSELRKQRFRWGKGALHLFLNHRKVYSFKPQMGVYSFPYILLFLSIVGFLAWQTSLYLFLPMFSLYFIYAYSIKELAMVLLLIAIPMFSGFFTTLTTASLSHMAILTWPEKEKYHEMALVIPYVLFYVPTIMYFYIRGFISGISDRRKKKPELNLNEW